MWTNRPLALNTNFSKIINNMNNEIGRKLTSLTLMTIMLAGGMTIAAPSMMPQAAAAGALYVSAENAMFDNTFGGAQIIEVVVLDPDNIQQMKYR